MAATRSCGGSPLFLRKADCEWNSRSRSLSACSPELCDGFMPSMTELFVRTEEGGLFIYVYDIGSELVEGATWSLEVVVARGTKVSCLAGA